MAADYAQYAIDIAAQMSGGEQTTAQLDALTSKLSGSGKGAEHFQRAMQQVSSELDLARDASAAASTALGEGKSRFKSLELAALQLSKAEEKAGRESTKLAGLLSKAFAAGDAAKVESLGAALGAAQDDEARLAAELATTTAALNAQGAALKTLEGQATATTAKEKALAVQLGNVRTISSHVDKSLTGNAESLAKVQGALGQIGGPLGRLGQLAIAPAKGFADLKVSMGATNATMLIAAAGAAILAAAVVALTVAVVAGLVGIAKWGVGLADARREVELTAEAVAQSNPALGAASSSFARLTRETGQTAAQLSTLAKALIDAKVSAEDMPAALRAAALAESALGQGGAADFVKDLKAGKLSVQDFASTVESKFGGIVQRQMLGLGRQSEQLSRNFGELFSGLQINSVLAGMQTIVGIFDRTGASGRALEMFFGKVFQPLIDNAESAAYVVEAFVLGFLIGMTKIYLAAKPAINAVAELLGFKDTSLADVLDAAKFAGQALAVVFVAGATIFTAVSAVILTVVSAVLLLQAGIMALAAYGVALVVQWDASVVAFFRSLPATISGAVQSVLAFFQQIPAAFAAVVANVMAVATDPSRWVSIGTNMVQGIARGITGAAGAVLGAIGGVVSGAVNQAKRMLGIASPSKVFAQIGDFTGEGFVQGVEEQQGAASQAMGDLVEPPSQVATKYDALSGALGPSTTTIAAPATARAAVAAPAGASSSASFAGAIFNFYGVEGAEDAQQRFGEVLTHILEGDAASLGAEVPA